MKRDHAHPGLGVDFLWMSRLIAVIHDAHLFPCLLEGHAQFHSRQDREVAGPALDNVRRQSFLLEDTRNENLRLNERKLQRRRHDADDGEGRAVERDRLAENVLVATETFLPKSVTEHRDVRTTGPVFIGIEHAAEERLHAERAEKVFRDADAVEIFRIAAAGEGETGKRLCGKFRGALLLIAPGREPRPGNVRAIEPAFRERTPDADELFRMRIGKRPKEERVDRREEDRVRADAEGERDDGENGESGLAKELAKCVTEFFHGLAGVEFSDWVAHASRVLATASRCRELFIWRDRTRKMVR